MNRTIKLLMISDVFLITGFGMIDPILAIFIKDNLIGGTIFAAGLASMIFLIENWRGFKTPHFSAPVFKTKNLLK